MYISSIHLTNWRSYRDAHFEFSAPSAKKKITLIGAMNGHGKTSLLLSLYLGLFGRFGLRHAEGFSGFSPGDLGGYRNAVSQFRRSTASPDEPTEIDLIISPSKSELRAGVAEVRIVRRWFFARDGRLKSGTNFEEAQLYEDGTPQNLELEDQAEARLEQLLFPASFMPAFLFDGEQAQTLISNSGEDGLKKSIEVLYGTKLIEEADITIKRYISQSRSRIGGSRTVSAQEKELNEKRSERERIDRKIAELTAQIGELQQQRFDLESKQERFREELSRLGGRNISRVRELAEEASRVDAELQTTERSLEQEANGIGLALGLSRLHKSIVNRLKAERLREHWEVSKQTTKDKEEEVIAIAVPEPAESDDLLGFLAHEIREKVKKRFKKALEQIYNPPPDGYADFYLLGHIAGEHRERALLQVSEIVGKQSSEIREVAQRIRSLRQQKRDAEANLSRLSNIPREAQKLSDELSALQEEHSAISSQLYTAEKERDNLKSVLRDLDRAIGALQDRLESLAPEQKRIAVAERVHRTLTSLSDALRPLALHRMEDTVSTHFRGIADSRFRKARIEFPEQSKPILRRRSEPDQLIETMGGFERRSFGIAFSLALAEFTRRRMPLVIDTPMGNADTEYRPRLLQGLARVDLDQIIILTHDAEVTGDLLERFRSQVQQTFLVEFDQGLKESVVYQDRFFDGMGE